MFFDGFERRACLHDAVIVALVFRGKLLREKIEVRFPDDFPQGPTEFAAEFRVAEREAAFLVLAEDVLRQRFDQRVIQNLGVTQRLLGPFALGDFFHRAFVVEHLASPIAHDPRVLGNPDDAPVLAINLGLEFRDDSVLLNQTNKVLTPPRLHVNLVADVTDCLHKLFGRVVAVDFSQHRIGREVVPVRSGLENSLHDVFKNAAILFLRLSQRFLGAKVAGHRTLQLDEIAPQLKPHDHLMAENPQRLDLLRSQSARFAVGYFSFPGSRASRNGWRA